ncbi:acyl carrier protein [Lipingzhangella sp. LS1_29]|uniref:Acyl carrier protein n=1 Tax=Lipingzhangella rawalii TaxID=2055835 RepID=A0ABU2H4A9_9ACTN|nr:acyl carrier protein [Lipingzhangella rawalii]MDS1270130.1 acyl carrier protein [Lipingzhangella rawalii]
MRTELFRILHESFDVPSDEIRSEKTLDELGIDSVAALELSEILHERLGVSVSEDEVSTQNTVEQLATIVTKKAGA